MAIFAELHDGRKLEFPDGTDPSVVQATVKKVLGVQPAPQAPTPTNGNVAINAGNEAVAAPFDALLNAPTNVWNLTKAAYGTAATALGRPDLAPDITPAPDYARKLLERGGFIKDENAPKTPEQRLLAAGVKGGLGMAMNPSASIGQTAALMGSGALTGLASQGTKEATGSDELANSVAVLAPLGINAASNAARNKIADLAAAQSRNAPKDQAINAGFEAGYQVPPSSVNPSLKNRTLEAVAGKVATQQETSLNNVEVTDRLARKALGVDPDVPLTPELTQKVRKDAYQQGYAPLANAGTISTGKLYRQDLDNIVSQYQGAARSFPQAVRDDVSRMVDGLRRRSFDAGDAVKMSATLREDASKSFSTGDAALGKAQRAAADAIENQIERGLGNNPQAAEMMQKFTDARRLMAKAHTVEDAIQVGTGHVDARKLAAELQKGAPLSGELKVAAEFANNFKKAVQPPSMVGSPVNNLRSYATMGGGGIGALLGNALGVGPVIGGAIGAGIPALASPLAKSVILSKSYQKGLTPNYEPSKLAIFLASNPQLSSGAALAPLLLTGNKQ